MRAGCYDVDERIKDMDDSGIDIAVLSLGSPGVQIFDPATASALAERANDELAEGIAKYPDRFVGLAAFSPLDPDRAAKELERGVTKLGLRGGILNGHTLGTYLDDPKYWPVFEAAEALNVPIYLHPNMPSAQMIQPFLSRALDAAVYGFACWSRVSSTGSRTSRSSSAIAARRCRTGSTASISCTRASRPRAATRTSSR